MMATSTEYGFECTSAATGTLTHVSITHNQQRCMDKGINCQAPNWQKSTGPTSMLRVTMPDDEWHYFRAQRATGGPYLETNDFTEVHNGRLVYFEFP